MGITSDNQVSRNKIYVYFFFLPTWTTFCVFLVENSWPHEKWKKKQKNKRTVSFGIVDRLVSWVFNWLLVSNIIDNITMHLLFINIFVISHVKYQDISFSNYHHKKTQNGFYIKERYSHQVFKPTQSSEHVQNS